MDAATTKAVGKVVLFVMVATLGGEAVHLGAVAPRTGRQIHVGRPEGTATHDETHNEARGSAGTTSRRAAVQTSARALNIEAFDIVRVEGSGEIFRLV
jgi:hypothetical protein